MAGMRLSRFTPFPIAVALFAFPSVQYVAEVEDGPSTEYFGFPLPWNARGIANSMTKDLFMMPLLLDMATYIAIAFWLWRGIEPRLAKRDIGFRRVVLVGAWAYGAIAFAFMAGMLVVQDCLPSLWYRHSPWNVIGITIGTSL
jgi:hypothetical protein